MQLLDTPHLLKAGVPSYIVNIAERRVEYYATPSDLETKYGTISTESRTLDIPGVAIPVAILFEPKA
jgi:hypothetical protein